jgi:hypothetical protein
MSQMQSTNLNSPELVADGSERVSANKQGSSVSEDTHRQQFEGMEILGDPGVRTSVVMVHTVDVTVEDAHVVVRPVPDPILGIEDG